MDRRKRREYDRSEEDRTTMLWYCCGQPFLILYPIKNINPLPRADSGNWTFLLNFVAIITKQKQKQDQPNCMLFYDKSYTKNWPLNFYISLYIYLFVKKILKYVCRSNRIKWQNYDEFLYIGFKWHNKISFGRRNHAINHNRSIIWWVLI